ncbi:hypothetical protein CPB84DRAFT_126856 [Gymnopilus junonius]|uniref:Uncharacterized protein n=1 Tax=Gymnopilus junonius TaxID=109634 RepID=A0A9P5NEI8_GYMJU|nr:hypothetical protein CPB84DRAFT_126856 [Gymnopilus junonius]
MLSAAKTTKDTLDMASSQMGNGNSPTTSGLAVAAVGGAPLAKEASLPHTNGDCSRPNLNPVASRASTSDDFGGCNIIRGEDVHKDLHTRKSLSDMEHDGLGNASTSGMGTNAHMGTIDQRNGIGNGNSTGHPQDGDAEGTSLSMSEEEMPAMARQGTPSDVTLKLITIKDTEKSSPTKSSRHLDIDKPISFMTPCVPLPNEYVQDRNLMPVQPNDTTKSSNEIVEEPRAKVSPDDLQPGDQVVERVKRIHQGGLAPGPNGQPISAPGKTLLTIVSAQGTKYSLSDKNLAPGQQIIETVETIHEGFALPETPSISKRRWSWLGPLASPVATRKERVAQLLVHPAAKRPSVAQKMAVMSISVRRMRGASLVSWTIFWVGTLKSKRRTKRGKRRESKVKRLARLRRSNSLKRRWHPKKKAVGLTRSLIRSQDKMTRRKCLLVKPKGIVLYTLIFCWSFRFV